MTLSRRLVDWLDDRAGALLMAVLALCAVAAAGLVHLDVDNAVDVWFVDGDPALTAYRTFQQTFGNDEVVAIAVHTEEGALSPEGLARLAEVVDAAASTDGVEEVHSVLDIEQVRVLEDWPGAASESEAAPLDVGTVLSGGASAELALKRLNEDPTLRGRLVSEDGKTALVVARMHALADIDARRDAILEDMQARLDATGAHEPMAGIGVVFSALNRASSRDVGVVGSVSYGLIFLLLGLLFRRGGPTIITLAVVGCSAGATMGLMGWAGRDVNMVTMALPTFVFITGVADAVHMLTHVAAHQATDLREQRRAGLADVLWPCLFTSLTTAAGFLALGAARMQVVRDLGLFAAAGVVIAFPVSLLAVLVATRWEWSVPRMASMSALRDALVRVGQWSVERARVVLAMSTLVLFVAAWGVSLLHTDTYSIDYFYPSHPVRQDSDTIEAELGPYMPLELVLVGEDLRSAEVLEGVARWQDAMEQDPRVGWTSSIADVVRRMNQVLVATTSPASAEGFAVPATDRGVDDALFLYLSDVDTALDRLVVTGADEQWTQLRVTVGIQMMSAKGMASVLHDVEELADLPEGVRLVPSGYLPLYVRMMDYIVSAQIMSFTSAFLMIFVLLGVLFRSVRMAMLAMPGNLLPIFVTLGVMGVAGIRLDVATVTIAAIVLGLVVDDTTHFLYRFRELLHDGVSHEDAAVRTLQTSGVAMATTSVVLVLGFSVLALATVKSVAYFGVLAAVAMGTALVADLVLLPALLVTLKPRL